MECLYLLAREGKAEGRPGLEGAATTAVENLLAANPAEPWLRFYLGCLRWGDPPRAAELFRSAGERFAQLGDQYGEVRAGYNLARILGAEGRTEEAQRQRQSAIRTAAQSGNPVVTALGAILEAKDLYERREDLERARLVLSRVRANLFPNAPYTLQREWLLTAGDIDVELSRPAEARAAFQLGLELARAAKDRYAEPAASYGLLRVRIDELTDMPQPGGRDEILKLARETIAAAAAAGNADIQSRAGAVLALLADGPEARGAIDDCLETAPAVLLRSFCLTALARQLATESPERSRAAIEEAVEVARRAEDPWAMAFAWSAWMRTSWATEPVDRAVQDSLSALQAIEVLRDLQAASTSRAEMFTSWSEDYRWLVGRLLEEYVRAGSETLLAQAFEVAERSRARALIDSLEAARAAPRASAATTELQEGLAAVLADVARVQRRLLDPRLAAAERTTARAELERLELAESDFRNRIERADPVFAGLRRPHFAPLDEVRRALAGDQALLSFQIAPSADLSGESAGGGWLLVVTRDGARVYRSLDRETLRPAVRLFSGLFEMRNGAEAAPAAQFTRELLGTAVDDLPAAVTRLIVVPDDAVHQVPFAALRGGPGAEPLGARFEISVVPSATLWLRWSRDRPAPAAAPALVLADPLLLYCADSPAVGAARPRSSAPAWPPAHSACRRLGRRGGRGVRWSLTSAAAVC